MSNLNKDIEKFLEKINSRDIDISELSIETLRTNYELFAKVNKGDDVHIEKIEDLRIEFSNYFLNVRIYRPELNKNLPIMIYFHGGAWSLGSLNSHDEICRNLSFDTNYIVISVDWRLAPEHVWPAPIEDCLNIYNWVRKNNKFLQGNGKIIFAGDSAGANVIVASLIRLKKNNLIMPDAQVLLYPSLDLNFNSESVKKYGKGYFLHIDYIKNILVKNYALDNDINDPELSPLNFNDFNSFPKALIVSAEFDPLIDDSINYAKKLENYGVEFLHKSYEGMIHDFLHLMAVTVTIKSLIKDISKKIKNLNID